MNHYNNNITLRKQRRTNHSKQQHDNHNNMNLQTQLRDYHDYTTIKWEEQVYKGNN